MPETPSFSYETPEARKPPIIETSDPLPIQERVDTDGWPETFTTEAINEFKLLGISFRRSRPEESISEYFARNIFIFSAITPDFINIFLDSVPGPDQLILNDKTSFEKGVGILLFAKKVDFKDGVFHYTRSDGRTNYQIFVPRQILINNRVNVETLPNWLEQNISGYGKALEHMNKQRKESVISVLQIGVGRNALFDLSFNTDNKGKTLFRYIENMPINPQEMSKLVDLVDNGFKIYPSQDMQSFELRDRNNVVILKFSKYDGPKLKDWLNTRIQ